MLQGEWYRMTHNRMILITIVLLFSLNYYLFGSSEAWAYAVSADEAVRLLFCNPVPILWSGVVLSILYITEHFGYRTWNGMLYGGKGRVPAAGIRIAFYYAVGLLLEFLPLFLRLREGLAKPVAATFSISSLLAGIGLHALACLALLSIPMLISFWMRTMLWSVAVSMGQLLILLFVLERVSAEDKVGKLFLQLHPGYQMAHGMLLPVAGGTLSVGVVWVSIIYLSIGVVGSLELFRRLELK